MIALAFSLVCGLRNYFKMLKIYKSQVDGLKYFLLKQASADAAGAQTTAADAAAKAEAAEAAANRAAQLSEEANSKLNKKFKRSMMKINYQCFR